jgi:hypothetical protein
MPDSERDRTSSERDVKTAQNAHFGMANFSFGEGPKQFDGFWLAPVGHRLRRSHGPSGPWLIEPVRLGTVRRLDDDAIRSEVTEVLRALIRIDTTNPPGNETPAATFLKSYLEGAGVECELVAKDPKRANLVARIRGTGEGPTLALMGHTDVVPADPHAWTHHPFDAHLDGDGFVWGRGAVDMKNETATRAVTMALLGRSQWCPKGDLIFVAQADEENGEHEVGLKWLREERPEIGSDFAIDEGGGLRLQLSDGRVVVPINVGE